MKRDTWKAILFSVIILGMLQVVLAYVPTHFINNTNANCSDSYSRATVANPASPLCGNNNTFARIGQGGDVFFFATGNYTNVEGYGIDGNTYSSRIIFTGQQVNGQDTAIISMWFSAFKSPNSCWTWVQNLTGYEVWNMTGGTSCIPGGTSSSLLVFNASDGRPFYPFPSNANITDTSGSSDIYGCRGTGHTNLICRFPPNYNPNAGGVGVGKANGRGTFNVTNAANAQFDNLRIEGSNYCIYVYGGNDNLIISNNTLVGSLSDTGCIRSTASGSGDNIRIIFNNITRGYPADWPWQAMKFGTNTETGAIFWEQAGERGIIADNDISGFANGIGLLAYNAADQCVMNGTVVLRNRISFLLDDGIEIEDYACNYNISYNNASFNYISWSFTPADSSSQISYFGYNLAMNDTNIAGIGEGPDFKWYANPAAINWMIDHVTSCGGSLASSAVMGGNANLNMAQDTIVKNSLLGCAAYGASPRLFDGTGDSADNVLYHNSNLYKSSGTNYARRVNGSSSTTDISYSSLVNGYPDLFQNMSNVDPQLDDYGAPSNGSNPICTAADDGSYLGAIAGECLVAAPDVTTIDYTTETPADSSTTTLSYPEPLVMCAEINTTSLDNITFIWNGFAQELWQHSQLWIEFNNQSLLGENDSVIRDLSPYNRTINNSATLARTNCGFYGGCVQGNGTGSYATVDGLNLDVLDNYTIFTSFVFEDKPGNNPFDIVGAIFNQHTSSCRNGNALNIQNHSDGTYRLKYYLSNSTSCISASGNTNILPGVQYDVVVTKNDTIYIIYIDGERRFWYNSTSDTTNTAAFQMLTYGSGNTGYSFLGNVSRIVVLDVVVSDDQAREIHELSRTANGWLINTSKIIRASDDYTVQYESNNEITTERTLTVVSNLIVNAAINFSSPIKTATLSLGIQSDQDDLTDSVTLFSQINQLIINSTSTSDDERGYNRIWIKEDGYGSDDLHNMPLNAPLCTEYNYTNLTMQIGQTLEQGLYPILLIAQVPSCWANFTRSTCSSRLPNATFFDEFYNYTGNVAEHYLNECADGILDWVNSTGQSRQVSCGNFSKWYVEPWNEPFCPATGKEAYGVSTVANLIYLPIQSELKNRSSNISVSTPGQWGTGACQASGAGVDDIFTYLNSSQYFERFSCHPYDDANNYDPNQPEYGYLDWEIFLQGTETLYYTNLQGVADALAAYDPNIVLAIDEYQAAADYSPQWHVCGELDVCDTWMASALIHQSRVSTLYQENYYTTTDYTRTPGASPTSETGPGLWEANTTEVFRTKPLYHTRSQFANRFTFGENLYYCETDLPYVECLATDDDLMIVNKANISAIVPIVLYDSSKTAIVDENGNTYTENGGTYNISMSGFEVMFFNLQEGIPLKVFRGSITSINGQSAII